MSEITVDSILITNTSAITSSIEIMVQTYGISYIEAIIDYCNKNNLEIEFGADIVKKDPLLKQKVEIEARNLMLLTEKPFRNSKKLSLTEEE